MFLHVSYLILSYLTIIYSRKTFHFTFHLHDIHFLIFSKQHDDKRYNTTVVFRIISESLPFTFQTFFNSVKRWFFHLHFHGIKAHFSRLYRSPLSASARPLLYQIFMCHICAAKAFYSCPAIISQRLESRIISKEPQENTEEESKII